MTSIFVLFFFLQSSVSLNFFSLSVDNCPGTIFFPTLEDAKLLHFLLFFPSFANSQSFRNVYTKRYRYLKIIYIFVLNVTRFICPYGETRSRNTSVCVSICDKIMVHGRLVIITGRKRKNGTKCVEIQCHRRLVDLRRSTLLIN